jgi:hypothetical protein
LQLLYYYAVSFSRHSLYFRFWYLPQLKIKVL